MTFAPDSASEPAIARPIPLEAPVTSATLPFREICMSRKLPGVDLQRRGVDRRLATDLDASNSPALDLGRREAPTVTRYVLTLFGHVLERPEEESGDRFPIVIRDFSVEQLVEIGDAHAAVDR